MKRILHALAVLWPLPTRCGPCGFAKGPLPEGAIPCGFSDSPIREFAKSNTTKLQQAIPQNHKKAKPNFFTRGKTSLNCRFSLVFTITILFMCLTAARQVSAQAEPADAAIQPLQIGDKIPEELWNLPLQVVNHPEGKDTITLNDYRDKKLIILDFWATYCKPCIRSLEKLDSIQSFLGTDELAVLPVQVYDGAERAAPFMAKRQWVWPSVVNDTLMNKTAFSRYITGFGVVWIKNGRLLAVPFSADVTASTVRNTVNGRKTEFRNRKQQF